MRWGPRADRLNACALVILCGLGCGEGLYDTQAGAHPARDARAPTEAAAGTPDETPDDPDAWGSSVVGPASGVVEIPGKASLLVPSTVLTMPTTITLREVAPLRAGSITDRAYQVEAPIGTVFHGDPTMKIHFTPASTYPVDRIRLAYLQREDSGNVFWVTIRGSAYEEATQTLSGTATNIMNYLPALQFAPVWSCTQKAMCAALQACTGGACQ
jgi:hypothetical protein